MLYRLYSLFNVSKRRAATIAILCLLASIPFFFDPVWAMIGLTLLMYALIYGGIWFFKFRRDRRLLDSANIAQQQPAEIEPPVTSPGSSRLFVPPPLDRR